MATTRRDLRRAVADRLGDIKVLTARVPSSGPTTFRDDVELTDAQNAYLGSQAMPTAGTAANLGQVVRVIGSDALTHSLTVTPSLNANPAAGDEWELVDLNGRGWRFQDYHRTINDVLGDSHGGALVALSETLTEPFDEVAASVEIPVTLARLSAVYAVDADGERLAIPRARRPGTYGNGYWLEGSTLRIEGRFRSWAGGLTLVLVGVGTHAPLWTDDDVCTVDTNWLVPEVGARLASRHPDRQKQALGDKLKSEAEARRSNAMVPRRANSWVVR